MSASSGDSHDFESPGKEDSSDRGYNCEAKLSHEHFRTI